jgi:cystathionine beta-lyase
MPINFDEIIERRGTDSVKWDLFSTDILPMWVADMDFKVPEPITKALHKTVDHSVFGYTMDSKALRQTVVDRMKKLYDWDIDESWVVATTGLVSGFFAASNMLCKPGDGYLIQTPVYMPFNQIQDALGFIRQENPLTPIVDGNKLRYEMNWDNFNAAFHSDGHPTKMFLLCNPHNPIGKCFNREDLKRMAEKCVEEGSVIVSDEIHSELLLGDNIHIPIASISKEIEKNCITLVSPSKTFNIAGLFCGFAIISDDELRKSFRKTLDKMTLHVSGLSFVAAQAAFSGDCDPWLGELKAYLTHNRDILVTYIDTNLPSVITTIPEATYLGWLSFEDHMAKGTIGSDPSDFFLKKAKVVLNNGAAFGTGGEKFARINFGCPTSLLNEGLGRIKNSLLKD